MHIVSKAIQGGFMSFNVHEARNEIGAVCSQNRFHAIVCLLPPPTDNSRFFRILFAEYWYILEVTEAHLLLSSVITAESSKCLRTRTCASRGMSIIHEDDTNTRTNDSMERRQQRCWTYVRHTLIGHSRMRSRVRAASATTFNNDECQSLGEGEGRT